MQRGFDALIVRARVPWDLLRVCERNSIRAIVNHRIAHTSPHGHYTVLVGLDDGRAVVHDPKAGPARNLDRTLLLQLWQPNGPASEITGRVLVAIAPGARHRGRLLALSGPDSGVRSLRPVRRDDPASTRGRSGLCRRGLLWTALGSPFLPPVRYLSEPDHAGGR